MFSSHNRTQQKKPREGVTLPPSVFSFLFPPPRVERCRPVTTRPPNSCTSWPSLAVITWNKMTLFPSCRYWQGRTRARHFGSPRCSHRTDSYALAGHFIRNTGVVLTFDWQCQQCLNPELARILGFFYTSQFSVLKYRRVLASKSEHNLSSPLLFFFSSLK